MIVDRSPADELTLISAIISLTSPDPEVVDRVEPLDFGDGVNQSIWEVARELRQAGTRITARAITSKNNAEAVKRRVSSAMGHVTTVTDVLAAEREVRELAKNRRLHSALVAALERTEQAGTYAEALDSANRELARLSEPEGAGDGSLVADALEGWWEWQNDRTPRSRPISTPWERVDEMLAGGLYRGRTYVIGGRPGDGKSNLGLNMARHAAERGAVSAVFSLEMGRNEVLSRILASGARAEYGQIMRRQLDPENFSRIKDYEDHYGKLPLHIYDQPRLTLPNLESACRQIKRATGLDLVFVDYLQLMTETDSKLSRERQIAMMSRGMKILAKELDVVVVVASQLNRGSAGDRRAPVLNDLRESGAIEQDCDVAILLHRLLDDNGDPGGEVELILAKNRTGRTGRVTEGWKAYQARIGFD